MRPRSHHQQVGEPGILTLCPTIDFERAEQVFSIVPSSDSHYRAVNILQVRADVACLPKCVIGLVLQELVPLGNAPLEKQLIRVRQRSDAEEEIVTVWCFEVERSGALMEGVFEPLSEIVKKTKVLGEEKSAVVMNVITDKPIRDW